MMKKLVTAVVGSAVVLSIMAAPAQAAMLKAPDLEQVVLYAQMPKDLGEWEQNIYGTLRQQKPALCWKTDGTQALLKPADMGLVGYEITSTKSSGSVYVYQYPTAAKAKAAGKAIADTVCPDSPKVRTDEGQIVQASAGSDLSASTVGGSRALIAGVTYSYPNGGPTISMATATRQVGQAVIQVQVSTTVTGDASKAADTVGAMATAWIDQATKGYLRFTR